MENPQVEIVSAVEKDAEEILVLQKGLRDIQRRGKITQFEDPILRKEQSQVDLNPFIRSLGRHSKTDPEG